MSKRNTKFVVRESINNFRFARSLGLVDNNIHARDGKFLLLDEHVKVIDFINCSYLGLDLNPKVVEAYHSVPNSLGVNFCSARTRLSCKSLRYLEERLSDFFQGRAVTFPSVTTTHMSVLPLVACGVLIDADDPPLVHIVFDRFAHASMQFLIPILERECRVSIVEHNDLETLIQLVRSSRERQETVVYVADGVYSMGGISPVDQLLELSTLEAFYLYIDDAHGTSIFGERGQGPILSKVAGDIPFNLFVTFSMTKGFGVAGGGVVVSNREREELIRTYGLAYAFSAPLDFSSTMAAHASLDLHLDGTVRGLQSVLRQKVRLFDSIIKNTEPFSPIRMIKIGDERKTIEIAKMLLDRGFFTVAAFFPVVPRGDAQLRVCISTEHRDEEIIALASQIQASLTDYALSSEGIMHAT